MESTLIKCVIAGMAAILARWARRAALLVQIDPARGSGWAGVQLRGGLMFSNLRLQPGRRRLPHLWRCPSTAFGVGYPSEELVAEAGNLGGQFVYPATGI